MLIRVSFIQSRPLNKNHSDLYGMSDKVCNQDSNKNEKWPSSYSQFFILRRKWSCPCKSLQVRLRWVIRFIHVKHDFPAVSGGRISLARPSPTQEASAQKSFAAGSGLLVKMPDLTNLSSSQKTVHFRSVIPCSRCEGTSGSGSEVAAAVRLHLGIVGCGVFWCRSVWSFIALITWIRTPKPTNNNK